MANINLLIFGLSYQPNLIFTTLDLTFLRFILLNFIFQFMYDYTNKFIGFCLYMKLNLACIYNHNLKQIRDLSSDSRVPWKQSKLKIVLTRMVFLNLLKGIIITQTFLFSLKSQLKIHLYKVSSTPLLQTTIQQNCTLNRPN